MLTKENISSLNLAYRDLQNAESELNRPHEDVVTLSACHSVRNAMRQMLDVYLSAHGIQSSLSPSLNSLVELSAGTNPAFTKIDMGNIECKGLNHSDCDGKYCLAIENVTCCLNAANQVKSIVWSEFKIGK